MGAMANNNGPLLHSCPSIGWTTSIAWEDRTVTSVQIDRWCFVKTSSDCLDSENEDVNNSNVCTY